MHFPSRDHSVLTPSKKDLQPLGLGSSREIKARPRKNKMQKET